jgi:Spy/CpxP family protein refolding chaperone
MKRFAFGVLTLVWAAGTAVMAQSPSGFSGSYGSIPVPVFLPLAPPEQADAAAYWTDRLGLDAGQQTLVKSLLTEQQAAVRAGSASLEAARAALLAAVKDNASESQLDMLSSGLGAIFAQAAGVQAKFYARFYALLTPDQKQKFEKLTDMPTGATVSSFGVAGGTGGGKEKGLTVKQ